MNFLFHKKKIKFFNIYPNLYISLYLSLFFFDLSQLKYRYELNIELINSDIERFQKVEISELQNFDETKIKNQINKFINYLIIIVRILPKEITKQFKGNYISFRKILYQEKKKYWLETYQILK